MELRELVRLLASGYKVIAATLAVCLLSAIAAVALQAPEYTSLTRIYVDVETPSSASTYELSLANRTAQIQTITYKSLIATPLVLEGVTRNLSLGVTPTELASHVTAQSALDTSIIDITVVWPEPEMAAMIANEVAAEAISVLGDDANVSSRLTLVQAQSAVVPAALSSPNPIFLLGLAGFAGFLLGATIVVLRQGFYRRILFADQLAEFSDVPVLAVLDRNSHHEIQGVAETILSAKRFDTVRTIAVVSPLGHVEPAEITKDLSIALADSARDFSVIACPAKLARQQSINNPQHLDVAFLAIARGRDTFQGVKASLDHLDLLGVNVGGMILVTPAIRGLRARRGSNGRDVQ